MDRLKAIILAAGKGTRMQSDLPKVIHEIDHQPMVEYVIHATKEAGAQEVCLIIGYQAEAVRECVTSEVSYAIQEEQLGTGHAVKCAKDFIGSEGITLVLCGDTPLITGNTLAKVVKQHIEDKNAITVISALIDNPAGYGRIIRDENKCFVKSVEHKDATEKELESKEINSGMYVFNSKELSEALDQLTTNNAQGEYYLPDTLTIVKEKGLRVDAYTLRDAVEISGVNTKEQLQYAQEVILRRKYK